MGENIKIDSSKNSIFVDKFLGEYLNRGFGSMSKRDIDVLVMHLLMDLTDLNDESNFNLSIKLKQTEAKIKNLKYEANLKYSKSLEAKIKTDFLELLEKAKLQVAGKETWISLAVEDTFLRSAIKAKIKANGSFAESSFNSEVVKIGTDDFAYLMDVFSDPEEKEITQKKIIDLIKINEEDISFKKLFWLFLEKVVEGSGNEIGKKGIVLGISCLISGTSVVGQILDTLKSYIDQPMVSE